MSGKHFFFFSFFVCLCRIASAMPDYYNDYGSNDDFYDQSEPKQKPNSVPSTSTIALDTPSLLLQKTYPPSFTPELQAVPSFPSNSSEDLNIARVNAYYNVLERLKFILGKQFEQELPRAPKNLSSLPTLQPSLVQSSDQHHCPHTFSRCSSEAFYPSCDLPNKTDPETWRQKFNLYFDLAENLSDKTATVLNATLRLYKNYSMPRTSSDVIIKLHSYVRSLTKRRDRSQVVTSTKVSGDYIGWVFLDVRGLLATTKERNNHGLMVSVHDTNHTVWHAPTFFVVMDCDTDLAESKPVPIEVHSSNSSDRFPALNVVLGYPKLVVDYSAESNEEYYFPPMTHHKRKSHKAPSHRHANAPNTFHNQQMYLPNSAPNTQANVLSPHLLHQVYKADQPNIVPFDLSHSQNLDETAYNKRSRDQVSSREVVGDSSDETLIRREQKRLHGKHHNKQGHDAHDDNTAKRNKKKDKRHRRKNSQKKRFIDSDVQRQS